MIFPLNIAAALLGPKHQHLLLDLWALKITLLFPIFPLSIILQLQLHIVSHSWSKSKFKALTLQVRVSNGRVVLINRRVTLDMSYFHELILSPVITGTVSLPETPRVSSESRRSDVEYHHRLSLQINKENIGEESQGSAYQYNGKKMARRRRDDKLKQDDENTSPGYYARQIVKQVKERVSRKVGHDITNTVTSKDDNNVVLINSNNYASIPNSTVVLLRPTKKPKALNHLGDDNSLVSKQSITPSSSPRLRLLETKNKLPVTTTSTGNKTQTLQHSPRLSSAAKIITNHKSQDSLWEEIKQKQQLHQRSSKKGKGERYEKPPLKDPIYRKKEEQFVHSAATNKANITDNKCKKTALSTFFPPKKEPSSPPTKLLIKKV